jgi:glycogen debranching enzyme
VALFGRKINHAEHQLAFIEMLRLITDGKLSPEEAVRAYHGVLQGRSIQPHRSLEDDLRLTDQSMSYDGSATRRATVEVRDNSLTTGARGTRSTADWPKLPDGKPDFAQMTSAQRRAYDEARLKRVFG